MINNKPAARAGKRILVVLGIAVCVLSGCKDTWEPGKPLAKDKVKIGVIFPNWVSPESVYDYMHNQGILAMQSALDLRDDQIIRREDLFIGRPVEIETAMRDCIAEGAAIIIATSWDHRTACEKLAEEFPRVIFTNAMGDKYNASNFTNYAGRMYQAWYLSGIVAGMRTESGLIGFVAAQGKENSEVTGALNAFALGVERVNPAARVSVQVIHSWFDPMGETNAVKAFAASGCDVVAAHCDSTHAVVAAEKAGIWAVGYSANMTSAAPKAVLCSTVYSWGAYYIYLVRSVIDGTFTTTPYLGSLTEGVVGLSSLNAALVKPGTFQAVYAETRRFETEGFNVFDGELLTNDGRIIGKEGETLSDSAITGAMNWYYRNVIEDEQENQGPRSVPLTPR